MFLCGALASIILTYHIYIYIYYIIYVTYNIYIYIYICIYITSCNALHWMVRDPAWVRWMPVSQRYRITQGVADRRRRRWFQRVAAGVMQVHRFLQLASWSTLSAQALRSCSIIATFSCRGCGTKKWRGPVLRPSI